LRPSADRTVKTRKQGWNWPRLKPWKTGEKASTARSTARSNWGLTFVFNKTLMGGGVLA